MKRKKKRKIIRGVRRIRIRDREKEKGIQCGGMPPQTAICPPFGVHPRTFYHKISKKLLKRGKNCCIMFRLKNLHSGENI